MAMDGTSKMWSYAYGVRTPAHDAAASLDVSMPHVGFVVFVDETGKVVDSYETMDDDDGLSPFGFMRDGLIDSKTAAKALAGTQVERYDGFAKSRVALLVDHWFNGEPGWMFQIETESLYAYALVHGETGELIEDGTGDL